MAKRILVPLVPGDDADRLILLVADLARGAGATVRLLHVAPLPQNRVDQSNRIRVFASQERDRLEAEGHDHLAAMEVCLDGVAVEGRVRFGDLAEETALEADAFGAELIALAGRRRWWHPLSVGRVAWRIAGKAAAPVMVLAC
jgi:hypothetical protein